MINSLKYRPEVDGLRALAIIPVILFHLNERIFSGGYIGVDIFFVISGYLITSVIIQDLVYKKLSILNFYERRVRRIIPALFFVILISTPFFFLKMSSGVLWDYFQSLISIIIFLSNFLFTLENNYFDVSEDYKPFIHTWSLAVEEQFYIFIPLILVLFFKNKKLIYLVFFLLIMSLISFSICYFSDNIKIQTNSSIIERLNSAGWGSFFMPFGRYWELIAGSLVALYLRYNPLRDSRIISGFSLLTILFCIIYFDTEIKYPGVFTLIPVIATVLILLFTNSHKNIFKRILSLKIIVFVGLLSYSLYLWHQPIFTFFNLIYFNDNSILRSILELALIFFLSFITWKFIEKPFRNFKLISSKSVWSLFIIFSIIIISISILGVTKYGLNLHNYLLNKNINENYRNMIIDMKTEGQKDKYYKKFEFDKNLNQKVLLIGDSQTNNWEKSLQISYEEQTFYLESIHLDSVCYKYLDKINILKGNHCKSMIDKFLNLENLDKYNLLILLESFFYQQDIKYLNNLIKYLNKKNKNIIIVGNAEFSNFTYLSLNLAKKLSKNKIRKKELGNIIYLNKSKKVQKYNLIIEEIANLNNVKYFSEFDLYCNKKEECNLITDNFEPFFYDNMHLTTQGAKNIKIKLINFIQQNL